MSIIAVFQMSRNQERRRREELGPHSGIRGVVLGGMDFGIASARIDGGS